jgi:hypothetical protein
MSSTRNLLHSTKSMRLNFYACAVPYSCFQATTIVEWVLIHVSQMHAAERTIRNDYFCWMRSNFARTPATSSSVLPFVNLRHRATMPFSSTTTALSQFHLTRGFFQSFVSDHMLLYVSKCQGVARKNSCDMFWRDNRINVGEPHWSSSYDGGKISS